MTDSPQTCDDCGLPNPSTNPYCFCKEPPMTHAPERIWATGGEVYGAVELGSWADTVRHKGGVEYVRADLLAEAVKALEAKVNLLETAIEEIDAVAVDFGHFESAARTMKSIAERAVLAESN